MPRRYFNRYLPDPKTVRQHRHLQFLGERLHEPDLWHLNRRSFAGGAAVGLFMAFVPLPMQMILAAITAIAFRVNIVMATVLVWVSNPLTIPPLFYFCYRVGAGILGQPEMNVQFKLSFNWLMEGFLHTWQPLLIGCLIVGSLSSLAAYALARGIWRLMVIYLWKTRRQL